MKHKVLVVGQTPPPFGGQAMMIERLVKAQLNHIQILHVRMAFSDNFKSVGNFNVKKLFHIPELIGKVLYVRFKFNVRVLYYPPAGPNLNPLLRDLIILFFIRPFFKKTIFHFRAAGLSEFLEARSSWLRYLAKIIYDRPDGAVQLSNLNPPDGKYFNAKKLFIIKNGLEDAALDYLPIERKQSAVVRILYAGVINETKGILTIVDTVKILKDRGIEFQFICIGDFASREFEKAVNEKIASYQVENFIFFPGVKTGADKWLEFKRADIFCFPSFFESESFGNVLVEAMMFELPVIGTRWRGIPDIVDEETGLLVPVKQPEALSDEIIRLTLNPELRVRMGKNGRKKFLKEYKLSSHLENMEKMFLEVVN